MVKLEVLPVVYFILKVLEGTYQISGRPHSSNLLRGKMKDEPLELEFVGLGIRAHVSFSRFHALACT